MERQGNSKCKQKTLTFVIVFVIIPAPLAHIGDVFIMPQLA